MLRCVYQMTRERLVDSLFVFTVFESISSAVSDIPTERGERDMIRENKAYVHLQLLQVQWALALLLSK